MDLDNPALARLLAQVKEVEGATRAAMRTKDEAERDQAVIAMRLSTALRQKIETWIGLRAIRDSLRGPNTV